MVWDVSGHSISPLLGRLAMDSNCGGGSSGTSFMAEADCMTTSLCWKLSAERDGAPLLVTTTNYSACVWDLRSPVTAAKPNIRFGNISARKMAHNSSPYVQVACSRSHECATMDAAGTVRVFDIRMTDKSRYAANPLSSFAAFAHTGVGISYLPMKAATKGSTTEDCTTTAWITWGLDSPESDAVVKVWSSNNFCLKADTPRSEGIKKATEDYWFMDGSPRRPSGVVAPYHLIGLCTPPYQLACPRVCPDPVENGILTIGILDNDLSGSGSRVHDQWRAELWKLRPSTAVEMEANDGTFGMERLVSFDGGVERGGSIASTLGKGSRIGQLQAAELAITSYNTLGVHSAKNHREDDTNDKANLENDISLALCCLSDKGFVTTHIIPEALPKKPVSQSDGMTTVSPQRPALFSNARTKVFVDEREGGVNDAARIFGHQGERTPRAGITEAERNRKATPVKEIGPTVGPQPSARSSDTGMLFEMDVPAVAYGTVTTGGISGVQVGPADLASPKIPPTAALVDEPENTAARVRERMDNIETERIPCPRLAGASFGPGIGGLAMFNNGDVRKMWLWFAHAGSSRLTGIPASISAPEHSFSDQGNIDNGVTLEGIEVKAAAPRGCPRTMKDLMEMTEAAKEAQWGEVESGDGSADQEQSAGDNFFEYMSTGSVSSDSDDEPDDFGNGDGGKVSRIYESYFGSFRRPVAEPTGGISRQAAEDDERLSESSRQGSDIKVQVVGPSSDTLAPSVHVTHDYDKVALNNQSAELARDWELGQSQAEAEAGVLLPAVATKRLPQRHHFSDQNLVAHREVVQQAPESPTTHQGLTSYRRLAPSPQKLSSSARHSSDPLLPTMTSSASKFQIENEHGVHGGVETTRPNMQESMVFLRKLFSHQQDGNAFSSLVPPDSPMLHAKTRPIRTVASARPMAETINAAEEGRPRIKPGVYALSSDPLHKAFHDEERKLSHIKSLCLHNAAVCGRLGEEGKQNVWELLAEMVDRRINERPDAFNGWGGKGGGALGVELVASFMRYYETLGDVQMLATMVCVLSGGRPRTKDDTRGHLHLLPTGHDEKYDTYIRRYAELLFGWGLLVKRAELNKHLVVRIRESKGKNLNVTTQNGIALVFTCPKCGKDADFGTNVCRSCQDYAFRCSVCEMGVRGLFTVCEICGHGGHMGHMTSWFAEHAECPSGCGCLCTFSVRPQRRSITESNVQSNDLVGLGQYMDPLE